MNRKEEYKMLLAELDTAPSALDYVTDQAMARWQKAKRIRRIALIPICAIITAFITFVAVVNMSPSITLAFEQIPILRDLATAVRLSPSMSAVVDNEYVQTIDLTLNENDVTLRVEYVVVDQKQLNIFYKLESPVYSSISLVPQSLKNTDGRVYNYNEYKHMVSALSSGDLTKQNELHCITFDFISTDMPDGVTINSHVVDHSVYPEEVIIAEFDFMIDFDRDYTQQGKKLHVGKSIELNGQHITITTVEVYPSHIRLNIADNSKNTAWLRELLLYIENEKGERFTTPEKRSDEALYSSTKETYWLESAFFSESNELTLYITGAVWLDKDAERIKINLSDRTSEHLPDGVGLEIRKDNGWLLSFTMQKHKNIIYPDISIFSGFIYDETGSIFECDVSPSFTSFCNIPYDGWRRDEVNLGQYPYDIVYIAPNFSIREVFEEPIAIPLPLE